MSIVCPKCSAHVRAPDVDLQRMVAKCYACDAVFRFEGQLGARTGGARPPRPSSIAVEGELPPEPATDEGGYRTPARRSRGPLRLSYRWFRPMAFFSLVFSIVWCGVLASMYANMFATGAPLVVFLFPLLHVAAGVGIAYTSIAQLLNRTVIAIEGDTLRVRHGPLPWIGAATLSIDRIRQLCVRRRASPAKNRSQISYALCAEVDGGDIDLVRGIAQHDEARYLERVIEEHLSIVDDPRVGDGP